MRRKGDAFERDNDHYKYPFLLLISLFFSFFPSSASFIHTININYEVYATYLPTLPQTMNETLCATIENISFSTIPQRGRNGSDFATISTSTQITAGIDIKQEI